MLSEVELKRRAHEFLGEVQRILTLSPNIMFVNMDETAVYSESLPRTTIETVGAINVSARARDNASERVTAVLSVASNGDKLSPMIIFKGAEKGRIVRTIQRRNSPYPTEAIYSMQANAWMSEEIMIKWLYHILFPYSETIYREGRNVILVLDTLRAHQTGAVRQRIRENEIQTLFVPGGLTGLFQPLDVGINGPFKHWLREATSSEESSTVTSPEQRRIILVQKVLQCWTRIDREIVINSFNDMLIGAAEEVDDLDEIE